MKLPSRRPALSFGLVCVLAAILIVFGFLQVHWSGQVSQAVRERMRANLSTEVMRFRGDFHLQLARICWAFQPPEGSPGPQTLKFYAGRYDDWISASARPELVGGLFVWERDDGRLMRLDPVEERFKPAPWPESFARVRDRLEHHTPPSVSGAPPDVAPQSWTLFEEAHILFRPLPSDSAYRGKSQPALRPRGGVIVALNMEFVWQKLVPELVGRYFRGPAGSEYRVSIISGHNPPEVFYQSSPLPPGEARPAGDVVEDLVGRRTPRFAEPEWADEGMVLERGSSAAQQDRARALEPRRSDAPLLSVSAEGAPWQLVVRHRSGSVEAAVANLRRRNLAVSLGVLFLLAVSLALIVVSAQRAQRLATLQMDFVAGISHELRTPLAVICSAGENLADGVVGAAHEVRNYGALIRDEGRRLSEMVGNILVFAAGQSRYRAYQQLPVDLAEVAEAALASLQPAFEASQVAIETDVPPSVGFVLGDSGALVQCLQNLISNAIKYGGVGGRIRVRLKKGTCGQGEEVRVTVDDCGPGIDPRDLPHIFEPFYRGKNGGHAHGTGLGLSLAKDIAEAMGGRLSVETTPGQGSRFTLHLPALQTANSRT
ncbi:MAG: sensor histidine kinase [Terriglobia bacterium]